jgi:hypothetical protein
VLLLVAAVSCGNTPKLTVPITRGGPTAGAHSTSSH